MGVSYRPLSDACAMAYPTVGIQYAGRADKGGKESLKIQGASSSICLLLHRPSRSRQRGGAPKIRDGGQVA
eukprot:scaffold100277_cov30-Tisochrysis_lutea.AAC.3